MEVSRAETAAQRAPSGRNLRLTGVEMAEWLAVTPAAITKMKQAGVLVLCDDGSYDARASVRSYVSKLRKSKSAGSASSKDLDTELKRLKVANEERRNLEWRMAYGTAIAAQIREQLLAQVCNLRDALTAKGITAADFAPLLGALGNIDVDRVLMGAEGDTDELAGIYDQD